MSIFGHLKKEIANTTIDLFSMYITGQTGSPGHQLGQVTFRPCRKTLGDFRSKVSHRPEALPDFNK